MLKEQTTVDYACRIISILSDCNNPVSAWGIATGITAPKSYVCKVLSRMTKIGLLRSGVDGYELARPLAQLNVGDILKLCRSPTNGGPASRICDLWVAQAQQTPLADVL